MPELPIRTVFAPHNDFVGHLTAFHFQGKHTLEETDPFIMLSHHGPQHMGPNNPGMPFAPHPHKGFETITFIFSGDVLHRDSMGISSIIGPGGVQWMTAGSGIVHSENMSDDFRREGGLLDLVQLWVNLPSHLKGTTPRYQGLQAADIPVIVQDEGRVLQHLISGQRGDTTGPAVSLTGLEMSTLEISKGGVFEMAVPIDRRVLLYQVRGETRIGEHTLTGRAMPLFEQANGHLRIAAVEDSFLILGTGLPIYEPIVAYGPFVMNTQEEIREAMVQARTGQLGVLA